MLNTYHQLEAKRSSNLSKFILTQQRTNKARSKRKNSNYNNYLQKRIVEIMTTFLKSVHIEVKKNKNKVVVPKKSQ